NGYGQLGRGMTISAPSAAPAGSRADVTGRLLSIDPACVGSQRVALRVLRPTGIPTRDTMTSATGRYVFTVRIERATVVRVVHPEDASCERVRSKRRTIAPN
ncbi:MAG TPA: hypothetical protein VGQ50_13810, partial [Actinomycetota bacterium]|nr:hypothetical protein [Actinomycetota bacterium]